MRYAKTYLIKGGQLVGHLYISQNILEPTNLINAEDMVELRLTTVNCLSGQQHFVFPITFEATAGYQVCKEIACPYLDLGNEVQGATVVVCSGWDKINRPCRIGE